MTEHVCGLEGFDQMQGDACPACSIPSTPDKSGEPRRQLFTCRCGKDVVEYQGVVYSDNGMKIKHDCPADWPEEWHRAVQEFRDEMVNVVIPEVVRVLHERGKAARRFRNE